MLTGKPAYASAVREAHREYRQLRGVPGTESGAGVPMKVQGLWDGAILLQAFLRGRNIFKYLRRHEDRY